MEKNDCLLKTISDVQLNAICTAKFMYYSEQKQRNVLNCHAICLNIVV